MLISRQMSPVVYGFVKPYSRGGTDEFSIFRKLLAPNIIWSDSLLPATSGYGKAKLVHSFNSSFKTMNKNCVKSI